MGTFAHDWVTKPGLWGHSTTILPDRVPGSIHYEINAKQTAQLDPIGQ